MQAKVKFGNHIGALQGNVICDITLQYTVQYKLMHAKGLMQFKALSYDAFIDFDVEVRFL